MWSGPASILALRNGRPGSSRVRGIILSSGFVDEHGRRLTPVLVVSLRCEDHAEPHDDRAYEPLEHCHGVHGIAGVPELPAPTTAA